MRIDIITLFPEMFSGIFTESILKRAVQKGIIDVHFYDLRNYATNKYRSVDDAPYGGGAGMVIGVEPVANCIEDLCKQQTYDDIIFTSPDGELLNQKMANMLSLQKSLLFLCGHYKGIDERIREHFITKEISIGDYVLSGGELAAAVICDSIVRLIPGVLNDETSALSDSFQNDLISPPVYTRPADFRGWKVPEVLLSGHKKNIEAWRLEQSIARTKERRSELLDE